MLVGIIIGDVIASDNGRGNDFSPHAIFGYRLSVNGRMSCRRSLIWGWRSNHFATIHRMYRFTDLAIMAQFSKETVGRQDTKKQTGDNSAWT